MGNCGSSAEDKAEARKSKQIALEMQEANQKEQEKIKVCFFRIFWCCGPPSVVILVLGAKFTLLLPPPNFLTTLLVLAPLPQCSVIHYCLFPFPPTNENKKKSILPPPLTLPNKTHSSCFLEPENPVNRQFSNK